MDTPRGGNWQLRGERKRPPDDRKCSPRAGEEGAPGPSGAIAPRPAACADRRPEAPAVFLPLLPLALAPLLAPHGGLYRGPGATVPPGGDGGLALTASGNAPPVMSPGSLPGSGGAMPLLPDLTDWGAWWRLNQATFLALKEHVRGAGPGSGNEGWYLGEGQKAQRVSLGPTEEQVHRQVVPALLAVLEKETQNDLVTGAMVALAKIGEGTPEGGASPDEGARIEAAFRRNLAASSQEVRETAALAFGILASPRSIPVLAHLLWDTKEGRKAVGASEVDPRTRAFAAYGLGLVGARSTSESERQLVVSILRRGLEADRTRTRDLEVACLIAFGLVPLATLETPAGMLDEGPPPEVSRQAQLDYVLAILRDTEREFLARAQCPVTLARLLADLPEPQRGPWRVEVARELIERFERGRDRNEVLQSCVLALGQIGTNDGKEPIDLRIRQVLAHVSLQTSEPQARAFALVAAGEAGARFGRDLAQQGIDDARAFLVDTILNGKNWLQPWAGMASGVLCWRLRQQGIVHPALDTFQRVLRSALEDERAPDRVGAFALAVGLAGSLDSAPHLMKLLERKIPDEARGQVALGLALLGHREAIEPLRAIVADAKYRPELLRLGAMALALLDDKQIGVELATMLGEARSLAAQAAIAEALGFVGDRSAVDPLLALLASRTVTDRARAFAAVALGNVADKELLPWSAKLTEGLNYRAAPPTLSDPVGGTGILDIF